MGSVQFGIPRVLALKLKEKHGLEHFIETGTLEGHTSQWATDHFKTVVTVDVNSPYRCHKGVEYFVANSADFLESKVVNLPTFFWLDAHTDEECPVMREIAAINRSPLPHVILVDDARLFGLFPAWPNKHEVLEALSNGGKRTVYEIDDVIVAEPCP
jgi:hypothetical protein